MKIIYEVPSFRRTNLEVFFFRSSYMKYILSTFAMLDILAARIYTLDFFNIENISHHAVNACHTRYIQG
jgi:hypothetical protein